MDRSSVTDYSRMKRDADHGEPFLGFSTLSLQSKAGSIMKWPVAFSHIAASVAFGVFSIGIAWAAEDQPSRMSWPRRRPLREGMAPGGLERCRR